MNNTFDIYNFINSSAIANHCREIKNQFSTLDMAYLIWASEKNTIEEKHNAYRKLIETQPDAEIAERPWTPHIKSIHSFLQHFIELESKYKESEHEIACRNIAVINLKKLAGGSSANSSKSKSTLCFECHAKRFYGRLMEQINLIEPSVIICCGKDVVKNCLTDKEYITMNNKKVSIVNGYHPQRTSDNAFYEETINKMIELKILQQ